MTAAARAATARVIVYSRGTLSGLSAEGRDSELRAYATVTARQTWILGAGNHAAASASDSESPSRSGRGCG